MYWLIGIGLTFMVIALIAWLLFYDPWDRWN